MKKQKGLTMMEVLIVLLIVAILTVIATPIVSKIKMNIQIHQSQNKLKQLHTAVSIYRQDYEGEGYIRFDMPNAFYGLGLPIKNTSFRQHLGVDDEMFVSPCGSDITIFESWRLGTIGHISYTAAMYDPALLHPPLGNYFDYKDYVATYRENIVIFVDPYCNASGTSMRNPFVRKRGLAILLSGQMVNKFSEGNASSDNLRWYSLLPD